MPAFPKLKSGAVAQYPFQTGRMFRNEVLQFVAGDEQRFRTTAGSLRKWVVQLDLLDEAEMNQMHVFFAAVSGSFENFSFIDPADGTTYSSCNLASDDLGESFQGEVRGRTALVIEQNRT